MKNYKIMMLLVFSVLFNFCSKTEIHEIKHQLNIIKPLNGIYVIEKRNVSVEEIKNNYYEKCYYVEDRLVKIERYSPKNNLTDELSVAAITEFNYDMVGNLSNLNYYDSKKNKTSDKIFGYSSIEYIYDKMGRVKMEFYRDKDLNFLKIPINNLSNNTKQNFLAPILTYTYDEDKVFIKAFDENFNLLIEKEGDKPCIPFIDCGEDD